jgi:outer membrane protein OmpA-like peptidoglycan-associated protein
MLRGATRGIVPARSALPSVPSQARTSANLTQPPDTSATPCPEGSGICALNVEFETGSAGLTTGAVAALDNLGNALASLQASGFRFRIEGHTDTVGSDDYNRALSEQRADAVTIYLNRHFSIDRAHLQPVGMGKDHLLVATPDQTAEPRNRRVQVVNIGT